MSNLFLDTSSRLFFSDVAATRRVGQPKEPPPGTGQNYQFQELWAAHREPRFAGSCIICTNVAESGITIPNVGLVISSGVQRRVSTDVRTGATVNDRCLIKLPTSECVSPQFGGSWTLESSSLCHHPTVIIALNRTIRDGSSYVSCLTPIPEEWLVEKDWFIVNHCEDQFCRDVWSMVAGLGYQACCSRRDLGLCGTSTSHGCSFSCWKTPSRIGHLFMTEWVAIFRESGPRDDVRTLGL